MMLSSKRGLLLIILIITAFAPILLYTDRLRSVNARRITIASTEHASYLLSNLSISDDAQHRLVTDDSARLNAGAVFENTLPDRMMQRKNRVINMADVASQSIDSSDEGKKLSNQTISETEKENVAQKQQSTLNSSSDHIDTEFPVKIKNKQSAQKAPTDARVRQLKDLLIRGKVYLSLTASKSTPHIIRELRLRIKEAQRALGDASKDSDLPRNSKDKIKALEQALAKGHQNVDDCAAVVKKLRAMLHSTEEQLQAHTKQTMFLTQLTAKTLPKGVHCLPLRLSIDYHSLNDTQRNFPNQHNLENPGLYHYALFSDNILATAVVVNSTISHAKDPSKNVFHIVTDRLNYAAMRMWFLSNPPGRATIQVQKVEDFTWFNSSYSPVLKQLDSPSMIEYYFKPDQANPDPNLKFRNPKYLSVLNHLRFYLPDIFPRLNKLLFLDDDIVVQKDLTALWSIDLKGNVNGAVETCNEGFHQLNSYLNFSNPVIAKNFDPTACGWAYGMNIFDLKEWKKQNITEAYHSWQKLNTDRELWKLGTLPPGLVTFYKRTLPLNRNWHVLGLGYNPNVCQKDIDQAAVIHFNGNMKPWLEVGISKFRKYWSKFVDYDNMYLLTSKMIRSVRSFLSHRVLRRTCAV